MTAATTGVRCIETFLSTGYIDRTLICLSDTELRDAARAGFCRLAATRTAGGIGGVKIN